MSTDEEGVGKRVPFARLGEGPDGRETIIAPYDESMAADTVAESLKHKTVSFGSDSGGGGGEAETPTPDSAGGDYGEEAGPIRRFNDVFTNLGSVQLEALGMDGQEIAASTSKLRDEMYRSQFPLVQPRFAKKCVEDGCGTEYDKDVEFCLECAREEMYEDGVDRLPSDHASVPEQYREHPVRGPNPTEKREAKKAAESVNKEGQSLRELMKLVEDDQSRLGISVIVARKSYAVASGDAGVYDRGEIIYKEPDELLRGDPKRVVPVVDPDGRVGGWKWACPVHREQRVDAAAHCGGDTRCPECGAEYREVFFVERSRTGSASMRSAGAGDVEKVYFRDEVITWSRYFPRLNGLDGLSPVHHVWLKQVILHWMDVYGAAFYDPDSESYPNKFMVVHTTNPDAWERQFNKAEEDARENPYSEQIMYNEYSTESSSTPEVQVIDLMNDDLLGQDQQIRDQYKQDIRTQFGVTNIFDSEMKDAGGLNNEGLQIEITDREIASAMHDTVAGPLDELSKTLGIDDYIYEFVPPRDSDVQELRDHIDVGEKAAEAGLEATLEDEQVTVGDGEFEASEEEEGGGLADLFGDFDGSDAEAVHKSVPDGFGVDVYEVRPDPDERDNYNDDVLGVAVDMPEAGVYVDWKRDAFPDPLEHPHVSDYGSVEDLRTATNNVLEPVTDGAERGSGGDEKADAGPDGVADAGGERPWRADGTERTPAEKAGGEDAERKRRPEGEEGNERGATGETSKEWVPYQGPRGGSGWKNADSGEVVYEDEPPGQTVDFGDRNVVDEASLEEAGISGGTKMEGSVVRFEDGGAALKRTDIDDPERIEVVANTINSLGGSAPAMDSADDGLYMELIEGDDLDSADGINEDDYADTVAAALLAGVDDFVPDNVVVDGRGVPHMVDLDRSAADLSRESSVPSMFDNMLEEALDAAVHHGPDGVTERDILNAADDMMGEFDAETLESFGDRQSNIIKSHETIRDAIGGSGGGGGSGVSSKADEDKLEAVRKLDDAYKHIVWADETTKASPFWDDDESMPEFVKEVITDVAPNVIWDSFESMPGVLETQLADQFREQLTQPQGWSLRSIADNLAETFNVDPEDAELVARTESARILNEAREEGYERAGALEGDDERLFQWTGPLDGRTTDACRWMAQVTGWDDGADMINEHGRPEAVDTVGEPVTYSDLLDLEREATQKFFPSLGFRKHVIHPNERFTFTESFKMEHPGAAGPVEVDHKADCSAALSGTFVLAG